MPSIDFENKTARNEFFRDTLPTKYKDNDGFECDDTQLKRQQLKKLRQAIQTNVLEKLRNCRDKDTSLQLRWFRTCQFERDHETKEEYLAPKYADCCATTGGGRLEDMGPDMYQPTGTVTDTAEIETYVNDRAPFASGAADNDQQRIQNFVAHHKRVYDVVQESAKYQKVRAQMAELRSMDYGFLLPDCVTLPMADDIYNEVIQVKESGHIVKFVEKIASAAGVPTDDTLAKAAIAAITQIGGGDGTKFENNLKRNRDAVVGIAMGLFNRSGVGPMVRAHQVCHTGLLNRKPFMQEVTGSTKIANACRALASGCHKNCPSALGHLPEAYPVGTVAPGAKGSSSFWVNVLRKTKVYVDDDAPTIVTKLEWVLAPAMMVATLTTLKKCEAQLHDMVVKEYMCLRSKESLSERPPCSDLDTFNTSAAITALRSATAKLQEKGLSADQCVALTGQFGASPTRRSRSRRSRNRRSRRSRRSRKSRSS